MPKITLPTEMEYIPCPGEMMRHDTIQSIHTVLGCTQPVSRDFLRVAICNVILFDHKQHDYGPRNIGDFGLPGVIVRMNDKWSRIVNLTKGGRKTKALNESIEDSFRDLAVYGQIAQLLIHNKWPST